MTALPNTNKSLPELSEPRGSKADVFGREKDMLKAKSRYQGDALIEEFKSVAFDLEADEDATLLSKDTACRV